MALAVEAKGNIFFGNSLSQLVLFSCNLFNVVFRFSENLNIALFRSKTKSFEPVVAVFLLKT